MRRTIAPRSQAVNSRLAVCLRAGLTACQRKPNGNMPAVPERRNVSVMAMISDTPSCPTTDGTTRTATARISPRAPPILSMNAITRLTQLVKSCRTLGASTTCTGMLLSGARTGLAFTREAWSWIPKVRPPATSEFSAAAVGWMILIHSARRFAIQLDLTIAAGFTASELSWLRIGAQRMVRSPQSDDELKIEPETGRLYNPGPTDGQVET